MKLNITKADQDYKRLTDVFGKSFSIGFSNKPETSPDIWYIDSQGQFIHIWLSNRRELHVWIDYEYAVKEHGAYSSLNSPESELTSISRSEVVARLVKTSVSRRDVWRKPKDNRP